MMVRDRGHALTIWYRYIKGYDYRKYFVLNYVVKKWLSIAQVNKITFHKMEHQAVFNVKYRIYKQTFFLSLIQRTRSMPPILNPIKRHAKFQQSRQMTLNKMNFRQNTTILHKWCKNNYEKRKTRTKIWKNPKSFIKI